MGPAANPDETEEHPIIDRILLLLEANVEGSYQVSDDNEAVLTAAIDEYLGSKELPSVVDAILRLAHVLEVEADSASAAASLCAAIERDAVVTSLRQGTDRSDNSDSGRAFQSFAQTEARVLPKEGAPPEGAVKLDAFKAPRRV